MHYVPNVAALSASGLSGLGAVLSPAQVVSSGLTANNEGYTVLAQKLVNSAISLRSSMCERGWRLSRDGGQSVAQVNLDDPAVVFKTCLFLYKFQRLAGLTPTAEADENTLNVLKALSDLAVGNVEGGRLVPGASGLAKLIYQKFDWQVTSAVTPGQPTVLRNGQLAGCAATRMRYKGRVSQSQRDLANRLQRQVTGPVLDWLKSTYIQGATGQVAIGDLVVGAREPRVRGRLTSIKLFDIFRATLANYANVITDVWYTAPGTAPSSVGLAIQAAQMQGDYGFTPSRTHNIYGLLDSRAIKFFLASKDIATSLKAWVDSKLRITFSRVNDALRARDRRFRDVYPNQNAYSTIPWVNEAERRAFYAMARDGEKRHNANLVALGKLRADAKRQREQEIEQRRAALEAQRISDQQKADARKAAQQQALLNYAAGRLASKMTGGGGFAVNFSLLPTSTGGGGGGAGPSTGSLIASGGFNASNIVLNAGGGGGVPQGGGGGAAPAPEVIEEDVVLPPDDGGAVDNGALPPAALICPEGFINVNGECVSPDQGEAPIDGAEQPLDMPPPVEVTPPVETPKKGKGGILLAVAAGAAVLYSLMG